MWRSLQMTEKPETKTHYCNDSLTILVTTQAVSSRYATFELQ